LIFGISVSIIVKAWWHSVSERSGQNAGRQMCNQKQRFLFRADMPYYYIEETAVINHTGGENG